MISHLVRAGVMALVCVASTATMAPARTPYDGAWTVLIVTQQGICDPSYRYPIRINNGHVGNAGNATVTITGRVGKNGAVIVNVRNGDNAATGTGRLSTKTGGGSWSGGNGACSGIWQAERRG